MTTAPALPFAGRSTVGLEVTRRAGNLERVGFGGLLRCECALPGCRETVPAVATSYRDTADRFIVSPAHLGTVVMLADIGGGTVVRAADRFFVVELGVNAGRFPAAEPPTLVTAVRGRRRSASRTR